MIGHITYLSDDSMGEKFGRGLKSEKLNYDFHSVEFQVESYLRYQGDKFSGRFDANTYLLMTKALDYFDPAADRRRPGENLRRAKAEVLRDVLHHRLALLPGPLAGDRGRPDGGEERRLLPEIDAPQGHDAFLIPIPRYLQAFSNYMNRIAF
jgi:homoserine O-acetyltransferase